MDRSRKEDRRKNSRSLECKRQRSFMDILLIIAEVKRPYRKFSRNVAKENQLYRSP